MLYRLCLIFLRIDHLLQPNYYNCSCHSIVLFAITEYVFEEKVAVRESKDENPTS
jgi:hypothetical protein